MDTAKQPVKAFRGLNNVTDPMRLSLEYLTQADNVDVSWTNSLMRCRGFTKKTTNTSITGAYATKDGKRLYVVDSGQIRQMNADLTYSVVKTGLSAGTVFFEEVNGVVYYSNGVDFGSLEPTGWREWGIEPPGRCDLSWTTGALPQGVYRAVCTFTDSRGLESGSGLVSVIEGSGSIAITNIPQQAGYSTNVYVTMHDGTVFYLLKAGAGTSCTYSGADEVTLGRELPYWGNDSPRGTIVAYFGGKLYLAEQYPQYDYTAIWSSLPLQYHHFNFGGDGVIVPGLVRMMKACDKALMVGTDRQIFSLTDEQLTEEADYGVVPGWHASQFGGDVYFWSLRGLCSAMPFKNLTETTVSVPPGSSAGAVVMEKDGMRRYVVALRKDGSAYNRREV